MAHRFDTGLAAPIRTLILEGVVKLLEGLTLARGGYLRAVIPWGGIVRGYTDLDGIDDLKAALKAAPGIAVSLGDRVGGASGIGGYKGKGTLELLLYHYSNHGRSLTAGRMTADARALAFDREDPGLHVMMEHAEELLVGQRVGGAASTNAVGEVDRSTPPIKQIEFLREEELETDATHTIWQQRYAITIARTIDRYRNVTELLASLRSVVRPDGSPATEPDPAAPGAFAIESLSEIE